MTPAEIVDQGLALLGRDLGQPMTLDEQGVCCLEFNEGLACTVELDAGDGSLFIHGELLPAPGSGREDLFRRALALNLYCLETGGAAVAYDPGSDALLLCHRLPAELLEPEQISNLVGDFVLRLDALRRRLRADAPDPDAAAQDPILHGIAPGRLA
jgi:hypothetical protein